MMMTAEDDWQKAFGMARPPLIVWALYRPDGASMGLARIDIQYCDCWTITQADGRLYLETSYDVRQEHPRPIAWAWGRYDPLLGSDVPLVLNGDKVLTVIQGRKDYREQVPLEITLHKRGTPD